MEPKDAIYRSICSSVNMFPALSRQSLIGAPTVNSSQMAGMDHPPPSFSYSMMNQRTRLYRPQLAIHQTSTHQFWKW